MKLSQKVVCAWGLLGLLEAFFLISKSLQLFAAPQAQLRGSNNLPVERKLQDASSLELETPSLRPQDDPSSYVIFSFDNRPLTANTSHWKLSAEWNFMYAQQHGHHYALYHSDAACTSHDGQYTLSPVWCKIKAMLQVQEDFPNAEYFVYLDSDAIVDRHHTNTSLIQVMDTLSSTTYGWDQQERPIIFHQDRRNYWCNLLHKKTNYTWCFNSGTVVWHRHDRAQKVLTDWWQSSTDDYQDAVYNPLKLQFRTKWPFEQQQQEKIAQVDNQTHITIFPTPAMRMMKDKWAQQNFCLMSHAPSLKCFISHYCQELGSKDVFVAEYTNYTRDRKVAQGHGPDQDLDIPRKLLQPYTAPITLRAE